MEDLAIAMRREHAELGHHIGELRILLRPLSIQWNELVHVLRALEANVARHFAFEETDGYLADVPRRTPALEREVKGLRAQHVELRRMLRRVREHCEDRNAERVRTLLEDWLSTIAQHESRENALFLRLLEDGDGEGD